MRQVKYKRPPDFVDPLAADPSVSTEPPRPRIRILKPLKVKSTASHVDRVRAQKSRNRKVESPGNLSTSDDDQYGADNDFLDAEEQQNFEIQVFEGNDEYDHDSFYQEGENGIIPNESRLPLSTVARPIRVLKEGFDGGATEFNDDPPYCVDAMVECVLVNNQYIVLGVVANDGKSVIQCEAELKASDLSLLSDSVYDDQIDPDTIAELATQMVENVEMKIDKTGVSRLVLNLVSEGDDGDSKFDSINGDWESAFSSVAAASAACATEEELQDMLLPGIP